jgi:non-ribosomal peptide synthetase-like protein
MVVDTSADGKILTSAGDNGIRWRDGERLEDLFEDRCNQLRKAGRGGALAVDGPAGRLTYDQLDAAANRLAQFLVRRLGVRPCERIGLLFDDAVLGYVSMLAVLKAHAVYVPLDKGFPADRLSYISSDAGVRTVLSHSRLTGLAASAWEPAAGVDVVYLDRAARRIAAESPERVHTAESGALRDDLCYIIYTSGTTGRPKGVAISHPSICNFVRVAAETYGYTADDRVYQGLTMAFDFAVEETWVPWLSGATLVPKPRGGNLLGPDLASFLREQRITALCCVPTLLATLDEELPQLRFLLVSGEACPPELADRWHRPGRRFLNVYGPTEATVSATWTVLEPGRPVTIGVPLPTYSVAIVDRQSNRVLPADQTGEIVIGGIGLARGYLNLPDKTHEAFTPDFAGMPGNPSGRIYRTGDLGKINADGEIVHKGRIDTQVKIRGYRIELAEIESVLAEAPGVAQAVVTTCESGPGVVELAGYYRLRRDAVAADPGALHAHLRERLPAYMVPAYLVELAEIPMSTAGKVDRKSLPAPSGPRRQAVRGEYVEPAAGTEQVLADALAGVLGTDRVSADADFFDELGASSLLMARFIAALPDGITASMRDIYENRTVRRLAAVGGGAPVGGAPVGGAGVVGGARRPDAPRAQPMPVPPGSLELGAPVGKPRYALCGALQLLVFGCLIGLLAFAVDAGSAWLTASHGAGDLVERVVVFGVALQAGLAALPIAAKWLLIGRWKPGRVTIWSFAYLRFWIVKSLLVASPLALLSVGTPLLNLYLRALGAKVGRGAVIFSAHVPVVTDLLTVGPGTVVRKACFFNGYRARGGVIEIAPVTLGADVFVGEQTVLDIGTGLGDGATLGHSSSLLAGQVVPAGACWHGSPARPAPGEYDYRMAGTARCGRLRRAWYAGSRLAIFLLIAGPVEAAASVLLWSRPRMLASMPELDSVAGAAVIGGGLLIAGLIVAGTVPRLLTLLLRPGKTYPLFGFHFTVQHLVSRWSNLAPFNLLFGDSVLITRYLKLIGYRLGRVEQTGSNFGTTLHHDVPALSFIGTGTMVSDGLSMINADFSSSAFQVRPVVVGPGNFLGNDLAWPAGARIGENCLIATKAMIPLAGPVRQGVGLLGSPCFEIPRTVQRDNRFEEFSAEPVRHRRIVAKTRHNLVTIGLHLLVRFTLLCWLLIVALLPVSDRGWRGWASTTGLIVADLAVLIAVFALADRAVTGFRPLRPRFCSIYQKPFWRHERYWKVPSIAFMRLFDGTPFKAAFWRLLGVRMGRRVFDDGCAIIERSLTSVGSDTTLNMACLLQGHSLEDGIFTSDRISIGSGCTVGTGAFVHYAVTMEDGALLEADSFAMKGSTIRGGSRWLGNPATEGETTWGSSKNESRKSAVTAGNGRRSSTGRLEAGSTTSTDGVISTSSPAPGR